MSSSMCIVAAACAVAASLPDCVYADDPAVGVVISPIVVTATRTEQNSFDLPVSIDAVEGETIREGQLQVNLSESAMRVPGVVVNNRNNPAQDLAVQVRGFGARSAFGVRGVRLYADGIPMSMPDGQGQTGTFNLDTAGRIEYLRGPFSALYGNSSGGVVQIFTRDGPDDPTLSGGLTIGSYDTRRGTLTFGDDRDGFNYIANISTYRTDGYRDHAQAERHSAHAKIRFELGDSTRITLVGTALDQPDNDDPQGLTAAEFKSNPKLANPSALTYNTRVTRSHQQGGAIIEQRLGENDTVNLMGYYGHRENEQYQSVTIAAQRSGTSGNLNGGGVPTIDRDFGGVDLRWAHKGKIADMPFNLTLGLNYDVMDDDRKGYENFSAGSGNTCGAGGRVCGVKGRLRRDENNRVFNFDEYLQAAWDIHPRWTLNAGVRHSKVSFRSKDHYFFGGPVPVVNEYGGGPNPDDSGNVSYNYTSPVGGVIFRLTDAINLYANAGRSFETPTFVELAYRPDGGAGLNFDLKPSKSRHYEVGAKAMLGTSSLLNVALFKIDTDDEIVVFSQAAGRTTYQNVPSTERKGLEVSLDSHLPHNLNLYLAYTLLDAEFDAPFRACNLPTVTINICNAGDLETINAGGEIPGTYRYNLYGELAWKHTPSGFSTALEVRKNSKTYVNYDLSDGFAKGYTVFNWRGGFSQKVGGWKFGEFVRVENITDRKYSGSVRVADIQTRFFEPAPTRNWLVGLNASYQF